MFIFCAAMNEVLDELHIRNFKFVAYADDLIIAVKRKEEIESTLALVVELFNKIGLKINMSKCHNTLKHEIEFMGVNFGLKTRNLPLAPHLITICKRRAEEFDAYIKKGIHKNVLLQFFTRSIIS